METEKIFKNVGEFGRYQKLAMLMIGSMAAFTAMPIYATVFILARPELICQVNLEQPENGTKPETCDLWNNFTQITSRSGNASEPLTTKCYFDQTYYTNTIITELELVCDRLFLASLTQTMFMVGAFSGIFGGVLSDKFGRRKVCMGVGILLCLTLFLQSILQLSVFNLGKDGKYAVFIIAQFFLGLGSSILYVNSYVLLVESTSSKYTVLFSNINLYFYAFGELVILGVSYFLRDWHNINWFLAGFSVVVLVMAFLLPESPKFLIAKKRFVDAEKLFQRIARLNGKVFPVEEPMSEKKVPAVTQEETSSKAELMKYFQECMNIVRVLMVAYIWIAVSLVYYGVGLGITSIGTLDPYLAFLFSCIAEIIGNMLCHLNDKFGQKRMFNIFLVLASVMCISVAFLPTPTDSDPKVGWKSILIMAFASVGKVMASGAFNSNYVFTSQLYPTRIRGTLVFLVSSVGRIGSLISPQINLLGTIAWGPLPYLIFGINSLIASVFVFLLPNKIDVN